MKVLGKKEMEYLLHISKSNGKDDTASAEVSMNKKEELALQVGDNSSTLRGQERMNPNVDKKSTGAADLKNITIKKNKNTLDKNDVSIAEKSPHQRK